MCACFLLTLDGSLGDVTNGGGVLFPAVGHRDWPRHQPPAGSTLTPTKWWQKIMLQSHIHDPVCAIVCDGGTLREFVELQFTAKLLRFNLSGREINR